MSLLAGAGRTGAAIAAADAFAATLSSDLGIAPSDALAGLTARIRAGGFDPAPSGPVVMAPSRPKRRPALASAAAVFLVAASLLWTTLSRDRAAGPELARLLVRPFEAGEGVPSELARGFSDDLATALVRRAAIDVLSRESGRLVAPGSEAASGASHVLRGRVRSEGEQWVLNVWIAETGDGREVWAGRFTGSASAPRDLREEIVARITDGIGLELAALPEPSQPTLPEEAVPAYLGALSRLHSGSPEGNAEALERFGQLAESHPGAIEPLAGLVVALQRVAFEADDYARAAGLHWLEGYLMLKLAMASAGEDHPDILTARAGLALRRLDHLAAQSLARRALERDSGHVGALAVLSRSLALTGETDAARRIATGAVALSPASPQDGYLSLALAAFAEDDLAAAREAVETAIRTARGRPMQLLALRAAILGLEGDAITAHAAFQDLVEALESRPFGAWRIGDVAFSNPRASTWRRPTAAEVATLVRYADARVDNRFRDGIMEASGELHGSDHIARATTLADQEIEDRLFNRRIVGERSWISAGDWSQVRTTDGTLHQDGAFGPLPRAREGTSFVIDGRLCDRWNWRETEIENCQLVMMDGYSENYILVGETGWFPFAITGTP
jgi:TolB-like protein